ncbi:MAG: DegT/DnrJ/EryC1/StrS aminotransferase family protein [Bryobacteraceae bacterium]|nr:DegT/DnrJ/EryC1/StrS aminotransferase family protein [Bryobacteraceae bacterium]MDW8380245.1 DegT/DnrJ/EryC1/StrS aminotransferase family protein [Bryobacterales bacterium]
MRSQFLPYSLPTIGEEEIREVVDSMRSGWLTTGPKVRRFEEEFAAYVGARYAVAVHSCTAALHLSLAALGIGPGDEVIVPTLTFCATANVVIHLGARPVLVDVNRHGLMDLDAANRALTPRTRAIVPVHYAGQACEMEEILQLAQRHGLKVIEDAAHAVGAEYQGRRIGSFANATAFSFYATKNMTTGEGGMITTDDAELASRIRRLALHGMSRDAWNRYSQTGSWYYEVLEPGFKYNMTDIQAAIGLHQLRKLDGFICRRRELAGFYRRRLADLPELELPEELPGRRHVYHLFPIRLSTTLNRSRFIDELKRRNIGASVHFIPLHRHPYYSNDPANQVTRFPKAERLYEGLVSLPLYPSMSDPDAEDVVEAVREVVIQNRSESASQLMPLTLEGACR